MLFTPTQSTSLKIFGFGTSRAAENDEDHVLGLSLQHKDRKAKRNVDERFLHCNYGCANTSIGHKAGPGNKSFQSFTFIVKARFFDVSEGI